MPQAIVKIRIKEGVLDPQGKAIAHALQSMGFGEVLDARQGKLIELTLNDTGLDKANQEARLREACDKLLANPIMEKFTIELN